jgi:hypothetical protein
MKQMVAEVKAFGLPTLVHCNGDYTIDIALDAIEAAYAGSTDYGINRIEHATMARPDQILRMKKINVQPSFLMAPATGVGIDSWPTICPSACWSSGRLHLPRRRDAGLSQSQGLRGVRRVRSAFRLERMGHVRALASRTHSERAPAADDHEIGS